jgi:BMFP domain-containing protein YqiC
MSTSTTEHGEKKKTSKRKSRDRESTEDDISATLPGGIRHVTHPLFTVASSNTQIQVAMNEDLPNPHPCASHRDRRVLPHTGRSLHERGSNTTFSNRLGISQSGNIQETAAASIERLLGGESHQASTHVAAQDVASQHSSLLVANAMTMSQLQILLAPTGEANDRNMNLMTTEGALPREQEETVLPNVSQIVQQFFSLLTPAPPPPAPVGGISGQQRQHNLSPSILSQLFLDHNNDTIVPSSQGDDLVTRVLHNIQSQEDETPQPEQHQQSIEPRGASLDSLLHELASRAAQQHASQSPLSNSAKCIEGKVRAIGTTTTSSSSSTFISNEVVEPIEEMPPPVSTIDAEEVVDDYGGEEDETTINLPCKARGMAFDHNPKVLRHAMMNHKRKCTVLQQDHISTFPVLYRYRAPSFEYQKGLPSMGNRSFARMDLVVREEFDSCTVPIVTRRSQKEILLRDTAMDERKRMPLPVLVVVAFPLLLRLRMMEAVLKYRLALEPREP